jgi:HAD superfamily hydrolase (TIGR01549 family)
MPEMKQPGAGGINPFDAILFDLGNTLIYFDGEWQEVLSKACLEAWRSLASSGLKLDRDTFVQEFLEKLNAYYVEREAEFIEYTTAYVLKGLLAENGYTGLPDTVLLPALDKMYSVSRNHWHVEKDTHSVLNELKNRGYRLGIISNAGDDEDVQQLVDQARIRPYFDEILSSAALGIRKPNPRIFDSMLSKLNVKRNRAAMVGDTLGADILGAQNAGIFSIFLTRRAATPANRAHLDTIQPDVVINSLSELPDLLISLSRPKKD